MIPQQPTKRIQPPPRKNTGPLPTTKSTLQMPENGANQPCIDPITITHMPPSDNYSINYPRKKIKTKIPKQTQSKTNPAIRSLRDPHSRNIFSTFTNSCPGHGRRVTGCSRSTHRNPCPSRSSRIHAQATRSSRKLLDASSTLNLHPRHASVH